MLNAERKKLLGELHAAARMGNALGIFLHHAWAQRLGMNSSDWQCMNVLNLEGILTAGQLAERVGLTKGGAITAALDRLERAGMVSRERDPSNRRRILVRVTDQALRCIGPLLDRFTKEWETIIASYTGDELRVLIDYAERSNAAVLTAISELQNDR
ncbi:MAG: MarR family winged helix-turn-helix transcriptional regulator [Candidatus Dormibacteraceae bacterium]